MMGSEQGGHNHISSHNSLCQVLYTISHLAVKFRKKNKCPNISNIPFLNMKDCKGKVVPVLD